MEQRQQQPQQQPQKKVYLESRYCKLERGLPQTIFYCPECKGHKRRRHGCERCDGYGKLTRDSVQELLARQVLPAFKAKFGRFHGAGREDIDVLMLGRGRPFVYEVVGARNLDVDLQELGLRIQERYSERIRIEPFRLCARERVAFWKESKFDKDYRLRVEVDGVVDVKLAEGLVGEESLLKQRTPQRVAHRRADLERQRSLTVTDLKVLGERELELQIRCEHGTYVKEWVSGDDGRTTPSLSERLGMACSCMQLDVLEILTD